MATATASDHALANDAQAHKEPVKDVSAVYDQIFNPKDGALIAPHQVPRCCNQWTMK